MAEGPVSGRPNTTPGSLIKMENPQEKKKKMWGPSFAYSLIAWSWLFFLFRRFSFDCCSFGFSGRPEFFFCVCVSALFGFFGVGVLFLFALVWLGFLFPLRRFGRIRPSMLISYWFLPSPSLSKTPLKLIGFSLFPSIH